ncbi:hypothetical protein AC249_AIPGENE23669 [Exaiptasia diaphana]|nr:hypothetical protein AC249_AIPGENE23669 [Exaiptasia diaphana]
MMLKAISRTAFSDFPIGQWYHMTVTWNRQAKTGKTYLNAVLKKSVSSPEANVDLFDTGELHYKIGAEGGQKMFNGWISQLVALPQELKQTEIENLKVEENNNINQRVLLGKVSKGRVTLAFFPCNLCRAKKC